MIEQNGPMIEIERLSNSDRAAWEALFRGYIRFYERDEPDAMYDRAWAEFQSGARMQARGAKRDGALLGIVHFLRQASTSSPDVCYLQDLFTLPAARGTGVGKALIEAVCEWARAEGCCRVHWLTHNGNVTARRLYDQVAENRGFIRYQIELTTAASR